MEIHPAEMLLVGECKVEQNGSLWVKYECLFRNNVQAGSNVENVVCGQVECQNRKVKMSVQMFECMVNRAWVMLKVQSMVKINVQMEKVNMTVQWSMKVDCPARSVGQLEMENKCPLVKGVVR